MSDDSWPSRPRVAVGPDRQTYFNETDIDRVMAILLALVSEVASIRERLDTHERIAGDALDPAKVEAYEPTPEVDEQREAWRDAYIRRLFRVITEDVAALKQDGAKDA